MADRKAEIAAIQKDWDTNPCWKGIKRGYTAEDIVCLRGSLKIEHTLAKHGAAGVHFEDQLSSVKKCGHLGGKVLLPTTESVQKLIAARLAADVMGVPTIILARTDAETADLLTSDYDENDKPFLTAEGFYNTRKGLDQEFLVVWLTLNTPIWFGVKLALLIWNLRVNLQKQFVRNSQARCWHTTVHHLLTGRKTWTMQRLRSSNVNWVQWATSISSLLSLVFTLCGTTCTTWRKTILSVT